MKDISSQCCEPTVYLYTKVWCYFLPMEHSVNNAANINNNNNNNNNSYSSHVTHGRIHGLNASVNEIQAEEPTKGISLLLERIAVRTTTQAQHIFPQASAILSCLEPVQNSQKYQYCHQSFLILSIHLRWGRPRGRLNAAILLIMTIRCLIW